jgi:hypothetical protein
MYLTPQHFRAMGPGIDLATIEDDVLRFHLTAASALVDSYCAVPSLPVKHDFRGGTVTDETHTWRVGNENSIGTRRIYLWHIPLRTITQCRIYLTNTQYVEIDPDDLVINQSANYAELGSLSLSPFGMFGLTHLPVAGVLAPLVRTSYTYGWRFPVVGEIMEATDGLLYRAQHQFWDATATKTIFDDGTDVTNSVTIDPVEGTALFSTPPSTGSVITATYTYTLPGEIAQAAAIICSALLGERELAAKGMNRLETIEVEEVRLRRTIPQRAGVVESSIPDAAKSLLNGFVYMTVR